MQAAEAAAKLDSSWWQCKRRETRMAASLFSMP